MKLKIFYISILILSLLIINNCKSDDKKISKNLQDSVTLITHVPKKAKEAIWYQIFPERFRNGDTTNDPTKADIFGTYPDEIPENWTITPWGSDWYKKDDWFKNSHLQNTWDKLQLRRYGGDLQGVIDELDYLQDLGITAVYFNPLNDAPSLHKYDPRAWRHIDVNFGPDPKKDKQIIASENPIDPKTWKFTTADSLFLKLIKELHKRNIILVMDYSWNHTGSEFWAFKDVKKNGKNSDYADWYNIKTWDNPETPENEFAYDGWAGVKYLPELKKDLTSKLEELPRQGNLHSKTAKQHIFNVAKRWLDPNNDGNPEDGIDGFRLDVAEKLPMGFWREFRKQVRSVNPDALLIGEIWWKKWPEDLLAPNDYLKGDVFDCIMNYRRFRPARHFFADAPDAMKPSEFVKILKEKMNGIEMPRLQAMMNVIGTHDSPRVSTSLYNNGKYKFKAKPTENPDYKIDKPGFHTRKIQKMLLIQQFTDIGAPHIFYGDEVGMWGADDPDCRKPMIWQDIKYEDETHHPLNKKRKTDKVEQDTVLRNFYKSLINIRKRNSVLTYGNIDFILADDTNNTLAYSRTFNNDEIIAVFNKSSEEKDIVVKTKYNGLYQNLLNVNQRIISSANKLKISLPGETAVILKYKK
ncbi:MAG: alpha-amylase [Chlorobi bacterium]|nr:alpha-amylase [Chlorobiota bacterium]